VSISINHKSNYSNNVFYGIISNTFTYNVREFKDHFRRRSRGRRISNTKIEKMVNKDFINWFPQRVCKILF